MRCGSGYKTGSTFAILSSLALVFFAGGAAADQSEPDTPRQTLKGSGLPVPRFVSLRADTVNLRSGPGRAYPTSWVFRQAGLPVEVVKEYDIWREVRDAHGTQGWIIKSLLSGRRTAQVLPWEVKKGEAQVQIILRSGGRENSTPVAMVEAGVVADIRECNGRWCRVTVGHFNGYIEQKKLWGVYDGEIVK